MGLRDSVAFRHTGGTLAVMNSEFHGAAGTERLYEGTGNNILWTNNVIRGGAGMVLPCVGVS